MTDPASLRQAKTSHLSNRVVVSEIKTSKRKQDVSGPDMVQIAGVTISKDVMFCTIFFRDNQI